MAKWKRCRLSGKARSCSAGQNIYFLKQFVYYVYLLRSPKNKDVYIGFSDDLKNRVKSHNLGKVKSTKGYRPWTLAYYEAYKAKSDASKRERELKLHAAKKVLLSRLENSIKEW